MMGWREKTARPLPITPLLVEGLTREIERVCVCVGESAWERERERVGG